MLVALSSRGGGKSPTFGCTLCSYYFDQFPTPNRCPTQIDFFFSFSRSPHCGNWNICPKRYNNQPLFRRVPPYICATIQHICFSSGGGDDCNRKTLSGPGAIEWLPQEVNGGWQKSTCLYFSRLRLFSLAPN